MNYKVLCSDLDGTLLSTKSDVSAFTISEIQRIKPTTTIILVSARMPKAIRYIQKNLGIEHEPIICYNGALIIDKGQEIHSSLIDIKSVEVLYHLADQHGIQLGLYFKDEWYVEKKSARVTKEINYTKATPIYRNTPETIGDWEKRQVGAHKIMLMGTQKSIDCIEPKLKVKFNTVMNIYRSNDSLIEVTPKSISKLSAIAILLGDNNKLKDVIAFGDNYNDAEMLKHAGCGVAVGNAREEVKAIADHTTLQNTKDGVAHFLNLHFNI